MSILRRQASSEQLCAQAPGRAAVAAGAVFTAAQFLLWRFRLSQAGLAGVLPVLGPAGLLGGCYLRDCNKIT